MPSQADKLLFVCRAKEQMPIPLSGSKSSQYTFAELHAQLTKLETVSFSENVVNCVIGGQQTWMVRGTGAPSKRLIDAYANVLQNKIPWADFTQTYGTNAVVGTKRRVTLAYTCRIENTSSSSSQDFKTSVNAKINTLFASAQASFSLQDVTAAVQSLGQTTFTINVEGVDSQKGTKEYQILSAPQAHTIADLESAAITLLANLDYSRDGVVDRTIITPLETILQVPPNGAFVQPDLEDLYNAYFRTRDRIAQLEPVVNRANPANVWFDNTLQQRLSALLSQLRDYLQKVYDAGHTAIIQNLDNPAVPSNEPPNDQVIPFIVKEGIYYSEQVVPQPFINISILGVVGRDQNGLVFGGTFHLARVIDNYGNYVHGNQSGPDHILQEGALSANTVSALGGTGTYWTTRIDLTGPYNFANKAVVLQDEFRTEIYCKAPLSTNPLAKVVTFPGIDYY